jgi:putative salt-induced outer membrane protein YdiY
VGGGLALTGGNTDTQTFNLSGEIVRDPQTRNLIKASASYLRGDQNDVLNLDRTAINIRDEYTVSGRTFAFGQIDYLRDQFKGIIFLWAPAAGLGYRLFDTATTELTLDGGAGGILEKNPGLDSSKSGSLTAGQAFRQDLSAAATFTQSTTTLWKTRDFADSLTNFAVGVTTTLAGNLELKVEFISSYKNKPANPLVKKNDTAFVTAFVVNF